MRVRRTGTIRFRITAAATAVVGLVLAVTALALVSVQRQQLTAGLDATLAQRADALAAVLTGSTVPPSDLGPGDPEGFAQLVGRDGDVLAASPLLAGASAIAFAAEGGARDSRDPRTLEHVPGDDDAFRVVSRAVDAAGEPAVLYVGTSLDEVNDSAAVLVGSLAVALPFVVALLAALVWWLVGRTLAPVGRIRVEVDEIGESGARQRVSVPAGDDEIGRLARTMNRMLDRLADARDRQQRFVADASHELRSPLARIRTELEVDEAPDTGSLLAEVDALQALVEDLLQLARADAGAGQPRLEPVDLDDIVLRAARRVRAGGRATVDLSGVSAAHVRGDRQQLERAVRNLVDNAERHAAGRITLTLQESDGDAVLTVADDGPGIPSDSTELVFERFGRLDTARARDAGGTGLGLAITRDIVERHGGTVGVDAAHDAAHAAGARFVVRLPKAP